MIGKRIKIKDDYYASIMRGKHATITAHPNPLVIARVDDLAPLGHGEGGGLWCFAKDEYDVIEDA